MDMSNLVMGWGTERGGGYREGGGTEKGVYLSHFVKPLLIFRPKYIPL